MHRICIAVCLGVILPHASLAATPLSNTAATELQLAGLLPSYVPVLYYCQSGIYDDLGNLDDEPGWYQPPSAGRIVSAAWALPDHKYLYAYALNDPNWLEPYTDNYGTWDVAIEGHSGYISIPLGQLHVIPTDFDNDTILDTSFHITDHACSAIYNDPNCSPFLGPLAIFTTGPDVCNHYNSDYYIDYGGVSNDAVTVAQEAFDGTQVLAQFAMQYDPYCCAHGIFASTQIFGFVSNAPPSLVDGHYLDGTSSSIRMVAPVPQVLLVHGICDVASTWDPFAQVLSDSGIAVTRLEYGSLDYNLRPRDYVPVIEAALNNMTPHSVNIVAHSMGGLITRDYMQRALAAGQRNRVASLITLGTPHHGSDAARALRRIDSAIGDPSAQLPSDIPNLPGILAASLRDNTLCQLDPLSRGALSDMSPGAPYLNALNYGANVSNYDAPRSRGGSHHAAETEVITTTPTVAIGGSYSFCAPLTPFKYFVWGFGSHYTDNDGIVATGSAQLTTSAAASFTDSDLSLSVTHAHVPPLLCGSGMMESVDLAKAVAGIILRGSSGAPEPAAVPALQGLAEATDEDSVVVTPAIVDTVSPGLVVDRSITVPPTTALDVFLVSADARISLSTPSSTLLSSGDPGHFGVTGSGFEGFHIDAPEAGTWVVHVNATLSAELQPYAIVLGYTSDRDPRLTLAADHLYPGDSLHVLAELTVLGAPDADVTWEGELMAPDSSTTVLSLYDDGLHDNGLSSDGVFGGTVLPSGGLGDYRVHAVVTLPSGESYVTEGMCEVVEFADLVVMTDDIQLSRNLVAAGDSVTVQALIHNVGTTDAHNVDVAIYDVATATELGTATVNISAGDSILTAVPWVVAQPDTHVIAASIAPSLSAVEASYTNNYASRTVVVGVPVAVEAPVSGSNGLWMAAPRPNPSNGAVTFWFSLPQSADAALDVFDILGRHVQGWHWHNLSAGAHAIQWDGFMSSGRRVSPGLFVCRLSSGTVVRTHKIVIRR